MYADWLHRAFQGGLRLMVMLAVNNEMLCHAARPNKDVPCTDFAVINEQLQAARAMEEYVRTSEGGWYHIVFSPREARETIASGRLAVVLGVEADRPFACSKVDSCTGEELNSELDHYYELGVRHFFPIHLANNEFGGMALYPGRVNWNYTNKFLNGKWLDVNVERATVATVIAFLSMVKNAPHCGTPSPRAGVVYSTK
jgi:microsomal dipeptidase-like Zn-dependent dipeptidase